MKVKNKSKYPNILAELARRSENQGTLAKLLGLSQTTISRKLSGKVQFSISEVEIICNHFNLSYYDLFK